MKRAFFRTLIGAAAAGAGGVAPANYYFVSPAEAIWASTQAPSGSRTRIRGRIRIDVASFDRKSIKFCFTNINNASAYNVIDAALESPAGTTIPVQRLGADTFSIPGSTLKTWTDPLVFPILGYSKMTVGESWYLNYIAELPASTSNNFGNVASIYDPSTTTPKSVDTSGAITFTGADFNSVNFGVSVISVGQPHSTVARPVWFATGDSIVYRSTDSGDATLRRIGFLGRGCYNTTSAGATGDALFNTALQGQTTTGYLANPFFSTVSPWAQYATHIIDELGINDLGSTGQGSANADIYTRMQSIYSGLRAAAAAPDENQIATALGVHRTTLLTYTTGSFPIGSGQVANGPGYVPGANMDQFNAGLSSQPNINGIADLRAAVVDPATNFWLTDMTNDGLHPKTSGHVALSVAWRAYRQAVSMP